MLVLVGDGTLGAPDLAPFQAIVGAAAAPRVPATSGTLDEGGRLVLPIAPAAQRM